LIFPCESAGVQLEILKTLAEPPEIAYHFKALQDEVMLIFSLEVPDKTARRDLFCHVVQNMVEKEKIALEDGVIRLFKNSKANRKATSSWNGKQLLTRSRWRRTNTFESDNDGKVHWICLSIVLLRFVFNRII
jgi:hypothetical protein